MTKPIYQTERLSQITKWDPSINTGNTGGPVRFYLVGAPDPQNRRPGATLLGYITFMRPEKKYDTWKIDTSDVSCMLAARLLTLFNSLTYEQMCQFVNECYTDGNYDYSKFVKTRDVMYNVLGL